jgi:membrane dipeptidase
LHTVFTILNIIFLALQFNILMAQVDYQHLHQDALVVDTHCDVLLQVLRGADISKRLDFGHVDLIRLNEGGVDVQFFAAWPDPKIYKPNRMYAHTMHMIDLLENIIRTNSQKIALTRTPEEIMKAVQSGKLAACIGVEGGTAIENDLSKLQNLYDRGVRYLGLTWNDSHDWASSAQDETSSNYKGHKGLTDFGKEVIKKMNELRMMIDVSHCGDQTFWDVIKLSSQPIIASHSCAYAIRRHYRNLKDDQIKAMANKGGVIFINFYPGYLDYEFGVKYQKITNSSSAYLNSVRKEYGSDIFGYRKFRTNYYIQQTEAFRPGIERILDHMDHIIKIVGDDHVGLGSDFDGISITPKGLEDASDMAEITKCMINRGYSEKRIRKILGENFMRVFKDISYGSN